MTDLNPVRNTSPPPDYDTTTHIHRHLLLATAVEADRVGDPCPVTLYHWNPPSIRALSVAATLSPSALGAIKGFAALGTYFLPEEADIAELLSGILASAAEAEAEAESPSIGNADPTPQLVADLIAQLGPPGPVGMLVRFFAFPVYTNDPELEGRVLRGGREFPVWKWVKPGGGYRRQGVWEAELGTALEEGEWNAGRGLDVLMGGVGRRGGGL
ncbi:hypothetical protein NEMBOFW57_007556 [Staphylotrichum longicolle]|uniref:Uncharacterized protein n=1 Tax=Staphylotrichum longicolle TaxID=669026 RepID=A0AAD4EVB4_9PEZI|nr:hypothetical protein NEMBOFW57_007556 [Staphylotrichum longicolle]